MAQNNNFYVGYLKMPPALARFVQWVLPMVVIAGIATALALSRSQNSPGDGVWQDDAQALVGRVSALPYPLIRVVSERPGRPVQTVLLVSEGKHGGGQRVEALDGRIAKVRGTILERDGQRLMELAEGEAIKPDDTLPAVEAERLAAPKVIPMGQVKLRGEIIDPKCYCGAMKPGEGKTHKACATLCIAGGIPPMFMTMDEQGNRSYYLLTDAEGRRLEGRVLHESVLPYVADAVEITGTLEKRDDLTVLRIAPAGIERL